MFTCDVFKVGTVHIQITGSGIGDVVALLVRHCVLAYKVFSCPFVLYPKPLSHGLYSRLLQINPCYTRMFPES